jgi:predicted lipoprotein with Yx(FWY)xxD motif
MPTFVCIFSDGEQTRMTVWCRNGLDVARGVKLARYAYESRKGKTPPPMTSATFVSSDGATLTKYDADELAKAACDGTSAANQGEAMVAADSPQLR